MHKTFSPFSNDFTKRLRSDRENRKCRSQHELIRNFVRNRCARISIKIPVNCFFLPSVRGSFARLRRPCPAPVPRVRLRFSDWTGPETFFSVFFSLLICVRKKKPTLVAVPIDADDTASFCIHAVNAAAAAARGHVRVVFLSLLPEQHTNTTTLKLL